MKQRKAKVTGIFSVIGLVLGLAISFFSSAPAILIAAGAIVGGFIGYFIGMKVDAQTEK
jgi:uncharacterized protein YcfJ